MRSVRVIEKIIVMLFGAAMSLTTCLVGAQPSGCNDCSRTAVLGSTRLNDPMKLVSSDAFRSSVYSRIAELVTNPCFHMSGADVSQYAEGVKENIPGYGSERRVSEYSFESELISGLNETGPDGRPVRSRWTISLWFEGSQREMVHSWQTLGTQEKRPSSPTERNTGTTFSGHGSMMSKQFSDGMGIAEIIKRFEKRPVECTITPEHENIGADELTEIKITDFRDGYGERSREFNRIVVHTDHGEIANGEDCDIGPDYKVFTIKDGIVRLKYRAPEKCDQGSDQIIVYNSCDVLPEFRVELSKTTLGEKIAEKKLNIVCYDAVLTLTARKHKERSTSAGGNLKPDPQKDCTNSFSSGSQLNEVIEAIIRVSLSSPQMNNATMNKNPMVSQTIVGFTPVQADLTGFSYSYSESSFSKQEMTGSDCRNSGSESGSTSTRSVVNQPSVRYVPLIQSVAVSFDPKTGKALKLGLNGNFDIIYSYDEITESRSRWWPSDSPPESKTKTLVKETAFRVKPVGDPIPDPNPMEINYNPVIDSLAKMKDKLKGTPGEDILSMMPVLAPEERSAKSSSKIHPDLLVTKGDGLTSFGGEGRKVTEKKLKDGYEKEELTFSWYMELKKR